MPNYLKAILCIFFLLPCATLKAQIYRNESIDHLSIKKGMVSMPLLEETYYPELFREQENPPEIIMQRRISEELVYYYSYVDNILKDSILRRKIYYNEYGDVIRSIIYKGSDDVFSTTQTEYLGPGLPKRTTIKLKGGSIKTDRNKEYQYDSVGLERFIYEYNGDTTELTMDELIYDNNERCIQVKRKYNNGEFEITREYTYNDAGNLVQKKPSTGMHTLFEYNGDPVKQLTVYKTLGKTKAKREEFYFNEKMQIVKVISWKVLTKIDPKTTKSIDLVQKEQDTITEFSYNADGSMVQKVVYSEKALLTLRRHYYKRF